jgi:hypothetical protein
LEGPNCTGEDTGRISSEPVFIATTDADVDSPGTPTRRNRGHAVDLVSGSWKQTDETSETQIDILKEKLKKIEKATNHSAKV